jgi:hypothetical protein
MSAWGLQWSSRVARFGLVGLVGGEQVGGGRQS